MCSEKEILREIMTTPKNVLANQILALVKRIDRDKETYNALASANEKLAARVAELEDVALCCSVCGDYDDCKKCPHGAGDLEDQIQSERGKPTCSK